MPTPLLEDHSVRPESPTCQCRAARLRRDLRPGRPHHGASQRSLPARPVPRFRGPPRTSPQLREYRSVAVPCQGDLRSLFTGLAGCPGLSAPASSGFPPAGPAPPSRLRSGGPPPRFRSSESLAERPVRVKESCELISTRLAASPGLSPPASTRSPPAGSPPRPVSGPSRRRCVSAAQRD